MKVECIECNFSYEILHRIKINKDTELSDDFKLYEVHFTCVCGNLITVDKLTRPYMPDIFFGLGADEFVFNKSADIIHDQDSIEKLHNYGIYPYQWGIRSDKIGTELYY